MGLTMSNISQNAPSKLKELFPCWLNLNSVDWDSIVQHKNADGFFDNSPNGARTLPELTNILKSFQKQFDTAKCDIDITFDRAQIVAVAEKDPLTAGLIAEMQAMIYLTIGGRQWAYAYPYLIDAYRYYRKSGLRICYADNFRKMAMWARIQIYRFYNTHAPLKLKIRTGMVLTGCIWDNIFVGNQPNPPPYNIAHFDRTLLIYELRP